MLTSPGNEVAIGRQFARESIAAGAPALANCGVVDVRHVSGVSLFVPAGAASQTLTLYACDVIDGTFLPLYDSAAAAVTLAVEASRAYDLPEAVFSVPFLKLLGTTAFTGVFCAKG